MIDKTESSEEAESNHPILEEAARSQTNVVNQPVLVAKLEGGHEAGMKIMLRKTKNIGNLFHMMVRSIPKITKVKQAYFPLAPKYSTKK